MPSSCPAEDGRAVTGPPDRRQRPAAHCPNLAARWQRRWEESMIAQLRGLLPTVLRQPAVRRGWSLIAKFLNARRLQAGNRDRIDFGAGQRPGRSFAGIAAVI